MADASGYRRYHIDNGRSSHEIVCLEYIDSDGNRVVVIPYFLLPRRKYPIYVYLYAIILYSSNPEMSQRKVAEATREKFGLKKFSHSTVCRVFSALEGAVAKAAAGASSDSNEGIGTDMPPDREGAVCLNEGPSKKQRFPSVADTAVRRKRMFGFLQSILGEAVKGDIVDASKRLTRKWHEKHQRLLL